MISFDKIVNKMLKKWWNLFFKDDIFEIFDPEKKPEYITQVNKIIYRLKSEKVIISIRNWVYLVPEKNDADLTEIDLIEKYYFKLLKKYLSENCSSDYYISWKKSLEFHLKNYGVPEKIFIVNRNIEKKIFIWNYEVVFKKVQWNVNWKKVNFYSRLSKMTKTLNIEWINFKVSNLELALVENALVSDTFEWVDVNFLNKTIKKYSKYFAKENFYYIWELKFIMAFNRLKELSKNIDKDLYEVFLDIIKKNWWLFIGEGLRKI